MGRGAMWKRFALGSALVFLLTAAATATAGLLQVKDLADRFGRNSTALPFGVGEITPTEAGAPQTFLLLGTDRRRFGADANADPRKRPRSDTMMLVRLAPQNPAVSVMSIPRDLRVSIDDPALGYRVRDKINGAYERGGPRLATATVRRLLDIPINHVVNVSFRGFRAVIQRLGGVYVDVDRRYYNRNVGSAATNYANIDVDAGYQRLEDQDALDYVRFRHDDNDLFRAARQQDFLRQAKQQLGAKRLFDNRGALATIAGQYAETDKGLRSEGEIIRVARLALSMLGKPVNEVAFPIRPAPAGSDLLVRSRAGLRDAVQRFLTGQAAHTTPTGRRPATPRRARRPRRATPSRLRPAGSVGQAEAQAAAARLTFPVELPGELIAGSRAVGNSSRAYRVRDLKGKIHRAYRLTFRRQLGTSAREYYGVQGLAWTDPPILDDAHADQTIDGRTYSLYYDGRRLRLVAWREGDAVYWVSNTILRSLSNEEMLGLARSARPVS